MGAGRAAEHERQAAVRPSTVRLPARRPAGVRTVFEYFVHRFPRLPRATWEQRFAAGKVWCDEGPVTASSAFRPLLEVHYRREVEDEPPVRTDVRELWRDEHLLVVDKPPHLPVTPGGRWVRHCLLHLLSETTRELHLAPLHRLDRLTSGLVVLSRDPATRGHYAGLFAPGAPVEKSYTAVCELTGPPPPERFVLAHHIARSRDEYWRQVVLPERPANARAEAELLDLHGRLVLLNLRPSTGRKHQLRVQLAHAGLPILGDPLYGSERSYRPHDLDIRMWLDAHRLLVRAFPAPAAGPSLDIEWHSSRQPQELLRRAVESSEG